MASFPGNQELDFYQGDEVWYTFRLKTLQSDGVTILPINLTGMNIDVQFRPAPGSSTLYASSSDGSIQILNRIDASGQFDIHLTSTTTTAFTWTAGAWDIQVSQGTGASFERTTYLYGPLTVTERVTTITY
jgi:hypothetical protein